jgi:hypothetical protein
VPNVAWRKKEDPFTPEELQAIHTALDSAFSQAVTELLNTLGLVK